MNTVKTLGLLILTFFSLMSINTVAEEKPDALAATLETSKKLSLDVLLQEVKQGRS